ncbi:Zinc induced facilitator-like, partial [Thalictrum thalictroides]
ANLLTIFSALPISSLFPFLYFMIRDTHIAKREEDIGYYAGFVGASFMFGRALTSVLWGIIADRYGRKPVIIFGAASVVLFSTLFGLSTSFWMAITTRFLLGSLNGALGPVKAYASEVSRPEHQALGLSLVSTAWGIGLIVGPAVGGFLAQPAEKYPDIISKESLLGRFPYLLPCLCISMVGVVVCVACFWLPETLHRNHGDNDGGDSFEALEASQGNQKGHSASKKSLLKNWPLMSSIIVYCIFSLNDMAYSEKCCFHEWFDGWIGETEAWSGSCRGFKDTRDLVDLNYDSYVVLLSACAEFAWSEEGRKKGKEIHAFLFRKGLNDVKIAIGNGMRRCGIIPSNFALISMLSSCTSLSCLSLGSHVHCEGTKLGIDLDVSVSNSLLVLYAECGYLSECQIFFAFISAYDLISWNSIIGALAKSEASVAEAIDYFLNMLRAGWSLNRVTFLNLLTAVPSHSILELGRQVHALVLKYCLADDNVVANVLLSFYGKSGEMDDCE